MPARRRSPLNRTLRKLRYVVVHRILHLDDTPHRIALGVLLGCIVGASPTLGLQILIYIGLATLLRANRVSGIPAVLFTNPMTAVPFYWFCWRIGSAVLPGGASGESTSTTEMQALIAPEGGLFGVIERAQSGELWASLQGSFLRMFAELWVGSLIVGGIVGLICYALTLRSVRAYRERKRARHAARVTQMPQPPNPTARAA